MFNLTEGNDYSEQKRDGIIDLRSANYTEEVTSDVGNEVLRDENLRTAINKILLLGIAARDITPHTLILRRDRQLKDGRWLQEESINILRDAAEAGRDRVVGRFTTDLPYHSVYDQLYDRFSFNSHYYFVERLDWFSSVKWNLMNDTQFEMRTEERQLLKDLEMRITKISNKLFRDMFYKIATSEHVPEKYTNLLEELIDPAIAIEFLSSKYWMDALQYTGKVDRTDMNEFKYYSWIREQELKIRGHHAGRLALGRSVVV